MQKLQGEVLSQDKLSKSSINIDDSIEEDDEGLMEKKSKAKIISLQSIKSYKTDQSRKHLQDSNEGNLQIHKSHQDDTSKKREKKRKIQKTKFEEETVTSVIGSI